MEGLKSFSVLHMFSYGARGTHVVSKELVPLKQVVKLRRDLSANDTSRHPKLLKIGPNHQCQ